MLRGVGAEASGFFWEWQVADFGVGVGCRVSPKSINL